MGPRDRQRATFAAQPFVVALRCRSLPLGPSRPANPNDRVPGHCAPTLGSIPDLSFRPQLPAGPKHRERAPRLAPLPDDCRPTGFHRATAFQGLSASRQEIASADASRERAGARAHARPDLQRTGTLANRSSPFPPRFPSRPQSAPRWIGAGTHRVVTLVVNHHGLSIDARLRREGSGRAREEAVRSGREGSRGRGPRQSGRTRERSRSGAHRWPRPGSRARTSSASWA